MLLNGKPVWTFAPTWGEGVLERLQWMTDVLVSASGAEQRRCMRLGPRRQFEARFYLQNQERQAFDISTFMAGGIEWYIPLWAEVVHLQAPLPAMSTTLPIDPADREFRDGDYVLLIGRDAFAYEIVQIATSVDDALQLIAATGLDWPRGTKVYPLRLARLLEQPTATKKTDTFVDVTVGFQLAEAGDRPADPVIDEYDGFPVLTTRPDDSEDLTHDYQRLITELDGLRGLPYFRDTAARGFTGQTYRWGVQGRQNYAAIRRLLHLLRGRWRSIWLPTFMQDMTITRTALATDSAFYVKAFGYTDFGGAVAGRDTVMILLRDGTTVYAKITSSAVDGTEEVMNLSAPLGVEIGPENVMRISYMALSRLDADQIELDHRADAEGLTVCSVTFKSVPNIRNATEWTPPAIQPFDDTGITCLPPCAPASFCQSPYNAEYTTGLDYNPLVNEIWVQGYSASKPRVYGWRVNPSTMEYIGDLEIPEDKVLVGVIVSPVGWPVSPFFFDEANERMYFSAKWLVSGIMTHFIVEVDMVSGECIQCVHQTSAPAGGYRRFWTRPSDNTLWCVGGLGKSDGITVMEIHRAGLVPFGGIYNLPDTAIYSPSPISTIIDNNGDAFFATDRYPAPGYQLTYFRTNTRTFGVSDFIAEEPWIMHHRTSTNMIYVGDSFVGKHWEIDCATGDATGNWINEDVMLGGAPWVVYDGNENCLWYDAVLDVIWSFNYYFTSPAAQFIGISLATKDVYGSYDGQIHPLASPNFAGLWGSIVITKPGAPRAFFVTGAWEAEDGTGWVSGLWKIPMCHVRLGRSENMLPPPEEE